MLGLLIYVHQSLGLVDNVCHERKPLTDSKALLVVSCRRMVFWMATWDIIKIMMVFWIVTSLFSHIIIEIYFIFYLEFDCFKLIQEQRTKSDDILHIDKKVTNRLYLSLCMIGQWLRNLFKFSILFSFLFVWTEAFQPFRRRIYELTHSHTYKLTPIQPAKDTIFQETK